MKGTIFLTFDLEEFDLPLEYGVKEENQLFDIPEEGLEKVLEITSKHEVACTFFATNVFAEKNPSIIRRLIESGHEIGSHGFNHSHNYSTIPSEESIQILNESRRGLKEICGCEVPGFRAPRMQPPRMHVLASAGFKYDSSLHPTYVPGRYNNLGKNCDIEKIGGIIEVPISVIPYLRLPYSWIWFRNLGLTYAKIATRSTLAARDFANIYFHPWEFVNLTKRDIPKIIKRNTGEKMIENFRNYVNWCLQHGFEFKTISDYFESIDVK